VTKNGKAALGSITLFTLLSVLPCKAGMLPWWVLLMPLASYPVIIALVVVWVLTANLLTGRVVKVKFERDSS